MKLKPRDMMACMKIMKRLSLIIALSLALAYPASAIDKAIIAHQRMPDGLYRVVRISPEKSTLEPLGSGEELLVNDFHFLEPAERQTTEYVVLQATPFIPFVLAQNPIKDKDTQGKPKLFLQLSDEQIKPLEDFTRKYTGGKVAIVIGGDIVTIHKVREAITGGRIQITRCTDNGCQAIYTEVVKTSK